MIPGMLAAQKEKQFEGYGEFRKSKKREQMVVCNIKSQSCNAKGKVLPNKGCKRKRRRKLVQQSVATEDLCSVSNN